MKKCFVLMLLMAGIMLGASNLKADSVEKEDEYPYLLEDIEIYEDNDSCCIQIKLYP